MAASQTRILELNHTKIATPFGPRPNGISKITHGAKIQKIDPIRKEINRSSIGISIKSTAEINRGTIKNMASDSVDFDDEINNAEESTDPLI